MGRSGGGGEISPLTQFAVRCPARGFFVAELGGTATDRVSRGFLFLFLPTTPPPHPSGEKVPSKDFKQGERLPSI